MRCAMHSIPPRIEEEGGGPVLRIAQLGVTFQTARGPVAAVQDASLSVARGECLGVVGESGAGKTQLFLAVLGLLPANARVTGSVHLGSEPLVGLGQRALDRVRGARIGLVFQDPMSSLTPHLRVGEQIAEPIVRHCGLSRREARVRARALLERVRVPQAARRLGQYPHELSGGMRQRVMIAIALACEPQLLIADEPTTALDVTLQAQILALFAQLKRESGLAMVLITHDFGAVAGLADRVAVMQAGRVVELDSAARVLKAPRHEYTRALLQRTLTLESGAPLQAPTAGGACGGAPSVLGIDSLTVSYPAGRIAWAGRVKALPALQEVSFSLSAGEALGVVGESGSGKSTLVRAALQLIRPGAGSVSWMGRDLSGLPARQINRLRRDLQIVFQDPLASLDPRMRVAEIVAEPLRVHERRLDVGERTARVQRMLARVGLAADLQDRYAHELSGGQCQRVGIARAMIVGPRLLVCDEPVSALDATVQAQILDLLASLKSEHGMSILLVSHNLAVVRRLCERVLVLYRGRMMELAGSGTLFSQPRHPYTRELLQAVPVIDPRVQPGRLALQPDAPQAAGGSEFAGGCVFRERCPHAIELCAQRAPAWEVAGDESRVACHRFRELPDGILQGP
jgi:peptide/nickel transport system ATP-binding protein